MIKTLISKTQYAKRPLEKMLLLFGISLGLMMSAEPAQAYIGPGLGAGAIGVVIGVICSVFLAVFAVIYYPVKRVLKKNKAKSKKEDQIKSGAHSQQHSEKEVPLATEKSEGPDREL